ncbi:MAG: prolipoprotein diacylglyceryl transferase [Bacteroidia bacterium]|nr:prolipoprotein diacylglyceryl transferase [Bacteroidia bacterium]
MYASLSDLLADLLGIQIPLPIQTFGFFMALAFVAAYYFTSKELGRKELEGWALPFQEEQIQNQKPQLVDYLVSVLVFGIAGFKLLEAVLDYSALVANPQEFLLSSKGSMAGLILGAGYGYYVKWKEAKSLEGKKEMKVKVKVKPEQLMGTIVGIAAIGGILGAKVFHNLENLDEFSRDPFGALISFSGLTFYGGLIVAAIGILYFTGKRGIHWTVMCDSAAVGLMMAYGIGRVGCHLSGDGDWGIVNLMPKPEWLAVLPDWFWSYNYPNNVLNEGIPIPGCTSAHCHMLPQPVFPTPLYEAIACILMALGLWSIRKNFSKPGVFFFVYLLLNGIERFAIEKIRVNSLYHIGSLQITQAEIISFVFIVVSLVMIYRLQKNPVSKPVQNL